MCMTIRARTNSRMLSEGINSDSLYSDHIIIAGIMSSAKHDDHSVKSKAAAHS